MSSAELKRERTSSKRRFGKACDRLSEAIEKQSESDLIDEKFEDVKI